jgi:hypothetical protein
MTSSFPVLYRDFAFEILTSFCGALMPVGKRSTQRRDEMQDTVCFRLAILPFWKCLMGDFCCESMPDPKETAWIRPCRGLGGLNRSLGRDGHVLDSRLRGNDKWGVQKGEAPLRSFHSQKLGDIEGG